MSNTNQIPNNISKIVSELKERSVIRTSRNGITVHGIDNNPQVSAAINASLSRNPKSMLDRIKDILTGKINADELLSRYFRDYGHNSIGDNGAIYVSVEGLSMLSAYLLINTPLFLGQEASTRYIDWKEEGFVFFSDKNKRFPVEWFKIYKDVLSEAKKYFVEKKGYTEKEAEPAAYDLAGGFLPNSARTSIVFLGTIRTFIERIQYLEDIADKYQSQEFDTLAKLLREVITEIAPDSVSPKGMASKETLVKRFNTTSEIIKGSKVFKENFDLNKIGGMENKFVPLNETNISLPSDVTTEELQKGLLNPASHLTFGCQHLDGIYVTSFRTARDWHRHRVFDINEIVEFFDEMPFSMSSWYCDHEAISQELRERILSLYAECVTHYKESINEKGIDKVELFGILPMATLVSSCISGTLPKYNSMILTRSSVKVHPEVKELLKDMCFKLDAMCDRKGLFNPGDEVLYSVRQKDA